MAHVPSRTHGHATWRAVRKSTGRGNPPTPLSSGAKVLVPDTEGDGVADAMIEARNALSWRAHCTHSGNPATHGRNADDSQPSWPMNIDSVSLRKRVPSQCGCLSSLVPMTDALQNLESTWSDKTCRTLTSDSLLTRCQRPQARV